MNTLDIIRERRSVKSFDPEFKISEKEELELLEHATQAPSSFNLQHWRFVVVKNKELRKALRAAAYDQDKVEYASILIVLCADLRAWEDKPEQYWEDAPEMVQKMTVPMIKPFYENNRELERDEAMRSVGLAGQTLMLAAKAMGFDSCPMIGFDGKKVGELINLPEDHVIGMMVTIGKALKAPWPKKSRLTVEKVRVIDRF